MTQEDIIEKIRSFLFTHVKSSELANDTNLFSSGLVNSLFAMQLVMFTEKEFKIKIENDDLDLKNFSTVNALAELVQRKL